MSSARAETSRSPHVRVSDEVADALEAGRPVVALETAAVTHGLPRTPLSVEVPYLADASVPGSVRACFAGAIPTNRALGHALAAAVRAEGAIPATIAMFHGQLVIGLSASELDELADAHEVHKVSARDVGPVAALGGSGGTTVAGTLLACSLARSRSGAHPIRVFATGGIGGVHRDFAANPDVSADLHAIRDTPTLVVCAGAKSILDLNATAEMLDTLGVVMVGLGTRYFPRFLTNGDARIEVTAEAANEEIAARMFARHCDFHAQRGMLLCVPPPQGYALDSVVMERAIEAGLAHCARVGARGSAVTPALLSAVAEATEGASLATNIAVLINNARVGARVAVHLGNSE